MAIIQARQDQITREKNSLDKELKTRQAIQRAEVFLQGMKDKQEQERITQENTRLGAQRAVVDAQQAVELAQIAAKRAELVAQSKITKANIANTKKQVELVNALGGTFINNFAEIVDKMIKALDPKSK